MASQITRLIATLSLLLLGAAPAWAGRGDIDTNYGEGGRLPVGCCYSVFPLTGDRLLISEQIGFDYGLHLRLFDAAGQLIPSFGDGGVLAIDSSARARTFQAGAAALAPNGDIVVLGGQADTGEQTLLRVDSNGQPVPSFGTDGDGFVVLNSTSTTRSITIDPDGRIVLVEGSMDADNNCVTTARLQRLLADGQPDAAFGGDGVVEIPELNICYGTTVFGARADGSVIVGDDDSTIVAVDADGEIDPAFGTDGRFQVAGLASAWSLLLPDGSLLVVGSSTDTGTSDTVFRKYDRNGQPDLTYGSGTGSVTVDLGTSLLGKPSAREDIAQMVLDPDGEHLFAALNLTCGGIARLTIDGTPDVTFGRNGMTCLKPDFGLVTVQSNGAPLIFLAYRDFIGRLLPENTPSPGILWSNGGMIDISESAVTVIVATIERLAGHDGAVSAGFATTDRTALRCDFTPPHTCHVSDTATANLDYTAASGRLDWADGDDGQRTVFVSILDDSILENKETFGVDISEPGGGALLFAEGTTHWIVDNDEEKQPPPPGGGGSMSWPTLLALFALLFVRPRRERRAAARTAALPGLLLLVSTAAWAGRGDIDPNYGQSGALAINDYVVIGLPDDRLAILGQNNVRVVDANGRAVATFGDNGIVSIPLPAGMARFEAYAGASGTDGRVLFYGALSDGGYNERYEALYLLDAAGHSDSAFGGNGDGYFRLTGVSNADGVTPFNYIASGLDPGGRIVLLERTVSGEDACAGPAHLRRLLPNGVLNESFGTGGTVELTSLEPCGVGSTFGVRSDGSIVVGSGPDIVSIDDTGAVDATFGDSGQLSAGVTNCCTGYLLPDGKLLLLGSVEAGDGSTDTILKKFNRNGEPDASFGAGTGSVTIDLANEFAGTPGSDGFMEKLLPSPDGSAFAVQLSASAVENFQKCYGIAKLTSSGQPDASFGDDGLTCLSHGSYRFNLVAVQRSGAPIFTVEVPSNGTISGYRLLVDSTPSPGLITFVQSSSANERAGATASVTLARLAGRDGAVSVDFTTASRPGCHRYYVCNVDSATAGSDFTAASGRLDWADGDDGSRSVTVSILDDDLVENREAFGVDFTEPGGGAQLIEASATFVLIDDDVAAVPPPPDDDPATSGGGGSMSWASLLALLALLFVRLRREWRAVARTAVLPGLLLLGSTAAWAGRGDYDPNYGEGGGVPISPSATLALPGDRLLITEAIDAGLRIRMVDAAGHDVPTFGEGGVVEVDSPEAAWPFWPDFAAHAPNGDMILAGSRLDTGAREILRLDENGQPVLTFGDRGDGFVEPALATAQAMALAVDADGRIVLAEGSWNSDVSSCEGVARIQRLLANGQPDTGFGGDGLVEIPDLNICGGAVVFGARADGSVVVGDGQAIVAVDSAGDNDLAFGAGGRLYPPSSVWTAGFLLPDESLLLNYSIRHPTGVEDEFIAKFDKNGLVDAAFGSGTGQVRLDDVLAYPEVGGIRGFVDRLMLAPDSAHLYSRITMRRPDASIFCVGIARYSIDGTFDGHFGRGGLTCLKFDLSLVAVQSTGAPLFLAGYDNSIHRLLADNSPSPGLLKVVASQVSVGESDGTAIVAVERLAGRDGAVSVNYTTSVRPRYHVQGYCHGCGFWVESATAGSDYTATSGRLDWADGDDNQQIVNVKIDRDQLAENLETFGVDFSEPGGGAPLVGSSVTVMIGDNEQTTSDDDATTSGGGGSTSWATSLALLGLLLTRRRDHWRRAARMRLHEK